MLLVGFCIALLFNNRVCFFLLSIRFFPIFGFLLLFCISFHVSHFFACWAEKLVTQTTQRRVNMRYLRRKNENKQNDSFWLKIWEKNSKNVNASLHCKKYHEMESFCFHRFSYRPWLTHYKRIYIKCKMHTKYIGYMSLRCIYKRKFTLSFEHRIKSKKEELNPICTWKQERDKTSWILQRKENREEK